MKIVAFADSPMNSGFGRISNEVFDILVRRGHQVHVVSLLWDGVAVDNSDDWYSPKKHKHEFQISGCAGRDIYSYVSNIVNLAQPDVVMSIQDFPYAVSIFYNCRIDWSRRKFVFITPIDGEPIAKDWLRLTDEADGAMVISEFGVQAMRRAGKKVGLCPPGINTKIFYPATPDEKKALRAKANLPDDAFVVGMMAMNQGRKDIPHTLDGFAKFAMDKPNAYLLMDMDKVSPAGWDIPYLAETKGIPANKIVYKEDLMKVGLRELRERFVVLDAHAVLAHREGFGLPLTESQACRIPTIAMDWCSGTEICNDGKGYLVRRMPQPRNSTWGCAFDYDPDVDHFAEILQDIYDHPLQAMAIADKGYEWVRARRWEIAANNVEELLLRVVMPKNQATEVAEQTIKRGSNEPVGIGNRPGIRTATEGTEISPDVHQEPAGDAKGSIPDGRQQQGVRPADTPERPVQRDTEREEPGIRSERKQGSEPGVE